MRQRRRARECALQMLFQIDVGSAGLDTVRGQYWKDNELAEPSRDFSDELVRGVRDSLRELDRWIVGSARNWRLERMAAVDRNVLRLAVYELLHQPDTPPAVVIDEAIELAKKFGSGESGSFVNGVLDSVRRRLEAPTASGTDGPPGDDTPGGDRIEPCSG